MRTPAFKAFLLTTTIALAASAQVGPTNPLDTNRTGPMGPSSQNAPPPGSTLPVVPSTPTPVTTPGTVVVPPQGPRTPLVPITPTPLPTIPPPTARIPVPPTELPPTTPADLPPELQPHPGGMTSNEAARLALSGYAPIAEISRANLNIALAAQREAVRAMIPQLSTSFRYTRLSEYSIPPIQFAPGVFVTLLTPILDQYDWRTTLSIPVSDLFLRLYPAYRSASLNVEAQALSLTGARDDVGLNARTAFFEYMRAVGQVRAADEAVSALQRHRDEAAQALAAGTLSHADFLHLEAQLASAAQAAVGARQVLDLRAAVLRQQLHMAGDQPIVLGEQLTTDIAVPDNVDRLIETAIAMRPEIQALDRSIRAMDQSIAATRAAQLPSLIAQGNYDYLNPNTRLFPQVARWDSTWDASLLVSWSPTQAFVADATVDRLRAQRALLEAQQRQIREATEIGVRQQAIGLVNAAAALESARSNLVSANEALRVRREQVAAGAAVQSALFDAEIDVIRARLALFNAVIDAREAVAQLHRILGEHETAAGPRRN